jgi:bacteriocin biosynthesis cyclodehydratase domain-containing protein
MNSTLRLHPVVRLSALDAHRVQIRTMSDYVTVTKEGALVVALAALCDGTRSQEEVRAQLIENNFPVAQVAAVLDFFHAKGYLMLDDSNETLMQDALGGQIDWLVGKLPEDRFNNRLNTDTPSLVTVHLPTSSRLSTLLASELERLGFRICQTEQLPPGGNTITVVSCDWDDHGTALAVNRNSLALGTPTLYVALTEKGARVGPFVLPGETPCFECFHHRCRAAVSFIEEFDRQVGVITKQNNASDVVPVGPPFSKMYAGVVTSLVSAELLKYLGKLTSLSLLGRVMEFDLLRFQPETGRVLRLPRCRACGQGRAHARPTRAARDLL